MHVLFVTPYYRPEVGAPQTRISETAPRLVARGHQVTVLTTLPNYPSGRVPEEYRHGRRRDEMLDGVRVIRVWSYISPNRGFLKRVLSQLSFGILAPLLAAGKFAPPDVIVVESPPLFDAFAGRWLARRFRRPFIFTVADIWPESAVQLGMLRNRLAIRLAERLETGTYRRARFVWAVTAGIQQTLIGRGIPREKIFFLPNGVDCSKFRPLPRDEARKQLGWDQAPFTLLYAGTIGLAHGLEIVLDAAERLRERDDIRFMLVGEGATKADLMAAAEARGLRNVIFMPAQPHDRMPLVLSAADACLTSLRKVPLFEGALPSKMYEAMACARPLVLAVDGEARELVERQAGAAVHVEPGNAAALAEAVVQLAENPRLGAMLGERGRRFVQAHFDRDLLVGRLQVHLFEAVGHAMQTANEAQAATARVVADEPETLTPAAPDVVPGVAPSADLVGDAVTARHGRGEGEG